MNTLEELQRLNKIDEIFAVGFYKDNSNVSVKCCVNLQDAAKFYDEHRNEFDYFDIDFCTRGAANFVSFKNIEKLSEYNYKREHKNLL